MNTVTKHATRAAISANGLRKAYGEKSSSTASTSPSARARSSHCSARTARARPRLIFLDEPATGLDPRSRHTTWQLIRDLVADGVTILLTTQYLEEADQLADRIAVLDQGRIVAEGTPEELNRRIPGAHRAVVARVQREGICWVSGTNWRGKAAMRISVSNWSTDEDDVDQSVAAVLRCAER